MLYVFTLHDQVPERDDKPKSNAINDLCFSPDGSKLVVAVENRVLVYDAAEGELLNSLRGHKDTVRYERVVWPCPLQCSLGVFMTTSNLASQVETRPAK